MNKIVLSMLLVASVSIARAKSEDQKVGPSKLVMALVKACGVAGDRIDIWKNTLVKCNDKVTVKIKTAMANVRNSKQILFGKEAVELRRAVEDGTQSVDNDVVMARFVIEDGGDTVTVESDIHRIDVHQASTKQELQEWEAELSAANNMESGFIRKDSCTECIHQWSTVFVHDQQKVLLHDKIMCTSVFPKQQFLDDLKKK